MYLCLDQHLDLSKFTASFYWAYNSSRAGKLPLILFQRPWHSRMFRGGRRHASRLLGAKTVQHSLKRAKHTRAYSGTEFLYWQYQNALPLYLSPQVFELLYLGNWIRANNFIGSWFFSKLVNFNLKKWKCHVQYPNQTHTLGYEKYR